MDRLEQILQELMKVDPYPNICLENGDYFVEVWSYESGADYISGEGSTITEAAQQCLDKVRGD